MPYELKVANEEIAPYLVGDSSTLRYQSQAIA